MRIAVDARVLVHPELRGIGRYLTEILAAWPESGDEFLLLYEDGTFPAALSSPARLVPARVAAPRGSRVHIWDWWALPRFLAEQELDVFWSPANTAFPVRSVPQVVTIHDTLLQEMAKLSHLERLYHRRLVPALARRHATRVLTVSRHAAGRVRGVFGLPRERVFVVPNGASLPERPFPDRAGACGYLRRELGIEPPFVYVLGARSWWKNTAGAIRAFALAVREHPDLRLVVSGLQPGVRAGMETLVRELGIQESARLFGFVDRRTRDTLYQGALLFLYPSLFEGFGLPPLEAMALGTPVIASDAASIPEVVGDAARMIDARDIEAMALAMSELFRDDQARERLTALGATRIGMFRWDTAAAVHREHFLQSTAHAGSGHE